MLGDLSYIVVLNYNNWKYTINCIKSLLNMKYQNFKIIIFDNDSTDSSVEYFCRFLNGEQLETLQVDEKLQQYINFERKKISYVVMDSINLQGVTTKAIQEARIIIIKNNENVGYAAGNNVAIKYAMQQKDCSYIWILNNDTIVDTNALESIVKYAKKCPNDAIIGAMLLEMNRPDMVQALGGSRFNYFFARGSALYNGYKRENVVNVKICDNDIGYISGASMFISKENLKRIGLIPEDFVYYFEEIVWCMKARKEGLKLGYASECIVFHESGATTKLLNSYKNAGNPYHFLYFRNKLIFARKYIPNRLLTVYIGIIADWIKKYFLHKEYLDCKIFLHWEMWKLPHKDEKLTFTDAMNILGKNNAKSKR